MKLKKNKKIDKGGENSDLDNRTHYVEKINKLKLMKKYINTEMVNLMASSGRVNIRNLLNNRIKNSINNVQKLLLMLILYL